MKIALSRKQLWEKTPHLLKTTLGKGLGFIPPAWLFGKYFRENYRFIQEAQWWTKEQFQKYQLNKLRELLFFAYKNSEFYRCLLSSVGFFPGDLNSLSDMTHLPIINKKIVTENLMQMCTKSVISKDVEGGTTGGTSGNPMHFYMNTNRSSIEYAYLTTSWERIGYALNMPMAVMRGRHVRLDSNGIRHEYDPILRHHYYSIFHASNHNIDLYFKHICNIGSCVLHTYPSFAHALARHLMLTGSTSPTNIKAVLLESENLYSDQIDDIEKAFATRTFSSYGHSEKCVLGAQCEHSRDYHIWPTYGYFELLDENDNPVNTPGQEGEIIGTGFINTVMPFIRYRTGDYATYVSDHCETCGRNHTIINNIQGRAWQEMLIAIDGSNIPVIGLWSHDDTFKNVREYQFYQSEPGKALFYVIPSGDLDITDKQQIIKKLNKMVQGQIKLNIEIKNELIKTSRGKQPRVIQKCNIPQ